MKDRPPTGPLLTVALASSALFDLGEGERIFRDLGREAYRTWVHEHEHEPLAPGVAFPFARRLLGLNRLGQPPLVEVVLVSRNDPDTGLRVRLSLDHHRLPVQRAAFTGGRAPWKVLEAYGADLFLTAHAPDVAEALSLGQPAGVVLPSAAVDDGPGDGELRIAFDFDGVLADDAGERLYRERGLAAFHQQEREQAEVALAPGPLKRLLDGLGRIQAFEAAGTEPPRLRIAIVTARSSPADRRVLATLRAWGLRVDEAHFVGEMPKERLLSVLRPHVFFDDKRANAERAAAFGAGVHVPFGVVNAS